MGLFDKVLVTGGVALAGAVARSMYKDAQETKRRKDSPLHFDEGLTEREFDDIARATAQRTPRVQAAVTDGMTVTLYVKSNSGLTSWKAEVDFNDYGRLTGKYWLHSENSDSVIPKHFADAVREQILGGVAASGRS